MVQISDRGSVPDDELIRRIESAGPRLAVQLRDPALAARALLSLGRRLREATRAVGARLWVNDRLDLALRLEADGVHLGRASVAVADARRLLGDAIVVTRSAHGVDEAVAAADAGVDAVLLSPIFPSPGKPTPLGLAPLTEARRRLPPHVALYALGGVDRASCSRCLEAGADGVAAIRADLTAVFPPIA
ncbi:MAG TPA: thiamine phosphate synthase [Polyangiaceae bacterium]|nr:thiamine phosphate synthase [Polyangiaceae bacterium]